MIETCDLPLPGDADYVNLVGVPDESSAQSLLLETIRSTRHTARMPPPLLLTQRRAIDQPRYPAALPEVWTVREQRHLGRFVGREDRLLQIQENLANGTGVVVQVIQGMGGVGTTRLAVEYAYRHRSEYRAVCWVRAGEPSTLVADYTSLAAVFGLSDTGNSDQKVVMAGVRRWFEEHRSWLLIFDNAADPEGIIDEGPGFERIRDFAPRSGKGHILVTTRDRNWVDSSYRSVTLDVLSPADAEIFLLRHTRGTHRQSANTLSHLLGCLPLALEQARAYIAIGQMTREQYIRELRESRESGPTLFAKVKADDYRETVASTWKVSIDAVRSQLPGAADFLEVLSFLDAEDIPRTRLLFEGMPNLTSSLAVLAESFDAFDDAIVQLSRYSLLRATPANIGVHRLVQAVVRYSLTDEEQQHRASVAVSIVAELFPKSLSDQATWTLCDRLVGHALSCIKYSQDLGVELSRSADLFDLVMTYLYKRARFVEAQNLFDPYATAVSKSYGDDSIEMARTLRLMSEVLYESGNLHMARHEGERAIAVIEHRLGSDHPKLIGSLSNLGLIQSDLGELEAAKEKQLRALRIGEATWGQDNYEVALVRSNLGVVYYELGDRERAQTCQERALSVLSGVEGDPKSQLVARRLALIKYDFGRLVESQVTLEQALREFDALLGDNHPEVGKTLHQLGSVLWDLGELQQARAYHERALIIFEQAYRGPHPLIGRALSGLAMVLQDQGDLEEALECAARGVTISEAVFGPDHVEVARRLGALGFVFRNRKQHGEAKMTMRRCVDIYKLLFGERHPELGIPLTNLGLVLQEMGDLDTAMVLHLQSISILEEFYDLDHTPTHLARSRLAVVLRLTGDLGRAKMLLEQAIEVFRRAKRPHHADVARATEKLAFVLEDMGDVKGAYDEFEKATSIFSLALGMQHPRTVESVFRFEQFRRRRDPSSGVSAMQAESSEG